VQRPATSRTDRFDKSWPLCPISAVCYCPFERSWLTTQDHEHHGGQDVKDLRTENVLTYRLSWWGLWRLQGFLAKQLTFREAEETSSTIGKFTCPRILLDYQFIGTWLSSTNHTLGADRTSATWNKEIVCESTYAVRSPILWRRGRRIDSPIFTVGCMNKQTPRLVGAHGWHPPRELTGHLKPLGIHQSRTQMSDHTRFSVRGMSMDLGFLGCITVTAYRVRDSRRYQMLGSISQWLQAHGAD